MERALFFDPLAYSGLFPEYTLLASVLLISVLVCLFPSRAGGASVWISIFALGISFLLIEDGQSVLPPGLESKPWTIILKRFLIISTAVTLFVWLEWKVSNPAKNSPLFFSLLLIACASLLILVQASGYWMLLLAAEGFSFCSYALVYNAAGRKSPDHAILRYFGTGALATGISVFGLSWLIGFEDISLSGTEGFGNSIAFFPVAGAVFFLAFLLFKLGAFPFQFWIPEMYAKAPAPVAGFLASAPKAAAAFACLNLTQLTQINIGFPLLCFALLSGIFGNLAAFQTKGVKEMLAYSAIGQASFLLIPVIFAKQVPGAGIQLLYFTMIYGSAIQGAFLCCQFFEPYFGSYPEIDAFIGSGNLRNHPLPSLLFTGFLISIIGIPPFAGFTAKLLIVSGLPAGTGLMGNAWPAAAFFLGLIITVLSAAYFFRLPYRMFFGRSIVDYFGDIPKPQIVVFFLMISGLIFQLLAFFFPGWFMPTNN